MRIRVFRMGVLRRSYCLRYNCLVERMEVLGKLLLCGLGGELDFGKDGSNRLSYSVANFKETRDHSSHSGSL